MSDISDKVRNVCMGHATSPTTSEPCYSIKLGEHYRRFPERNYKEIVKYWRTKQIYQLHGLCPECLKYTREQIIKGEIEKWQE